MLWRFYVLRAQSKHSGNLLHDTVGKRHEYEYEYGILFSPHVVHILLLRQPHQVTMQEPLLNNLCSLLSVGTLLVGLSYLLLHSKVPKQSSLQQQPSFSLLMNLHLARACKGSPSCSTQSLGGIWKLEVTRWLEARLIWRLTCLAFDAACGWDISWSNQAEHLHVASSCVCLPFS